MTVERKPPMECIALSIGAWPKLGMHGTIINMYKNVKIKVDAADVVDRLTQMQMRGW
jgi:hypothetical protein